MDEKRKKQLKWLTIHTIIFLIALILIWTLFPPPMEAANEFVPNWFQEFDSRILASLIFLILYLGWGVVGSVVIYRKKKNKLKEDEITNPLEPQ